MQSRGNPNKYLMILLFMHIQITISDMPVAQSAQTFKLLKANRIRYWVAPINELYCWLGQGRVFLFCLRDRLGERFISKLMVLKYCTHFWRSCLGKLAARSLTAAQTYIHAGTQIWSADGAKGTTNCFAPPRKQTAIANMRRLKLLQHPRVWN